VSTPANGHDAPQYQPQPGQPQGYPPQQPPKKKRSLAKLGCLGLLGLIALIVVIAIIAAIAGGGGDDSTESSDKPETSEQSTGEAAQDVAEEAAPAGAGLTLSTSGAGSVTYGSGGSMSTADSTGEWSQEIPDAEPADMYSVTIQDMSGAADAEVSCTITTDGEEVASETATGAYGIATCTQPLF
jgi:type II secretory pathway pseudopilin PulG